jgi:aerobic carbon-monoxide dehydrogenase large subunit
MGLIGTPVARVEDRRLVTGGGSFVDNLRAPELAGAAHVTFVRSPVAHARIRVVDIAAARAAPGVLAVVTAADLEVPRAEPATGPADMGQPCLAVDTVRYVGEPVAAVVTDGWDQGEDAAELVNVEYEPLPAVIGVDTALADQVLLFPECGTNLAFETGRLDDGDLFAGCDVVVSRQLVNQRLAAAPLEPRCAACVPGPGHRLTLWVSTQTPHDVRDELTQRLGLAAGQLRVIAPDVGGGFGAKIGTDAEVVVVCWLARALGRPVRWTETRTDNLICSGHGRGQRQKVTIGGGRDGTLAAYRLDVVADAGAYPRLGAVLPSLTVQMAAGGYAIRRVAARGRSVVTNTAPVVAYRGAGRPEAAAAIERAVDLFAAEIGMDPAEVRRRNLIAPESLPYRSPTGVEYDSGDYGRALEAVLTAADYPRLRAEQARRRAAGDHRLYGIGLSVYVEMTGMGGPEQARVELRSAGTFVGYVGTSPHGQGHDTSFAMLLADALGVPMDCVTLVHGDTDRVASGVGTYASRSLQIGGSALHRAALALCEQARGFAAAALRVDEREVMLDRSTGRWHAGHAASTGLTWSALAALHPGLSADGKYDSDPTVPFGAHLALVEVDIDTGQVTLRRYLAVDDVGRVVNPLIAEGQRHGGIAQGIGQALYAAFVYDQAGNPLTASLIDYTIPSAADLPNFHLLPMQTPTPRNPLGVKGVGESGAIGAPPAIQNAVIDALSHLGVRHIDMPLTPSKVWTTIRDSHPRSTPHHTETWHQQ